MAKETTRITGKFTASGARGITKARSKPMPTEEQIRARAYQIYLARNGAPGDAVADWIQAQRELAEETAQ